METVMEVDGVETVVEVKGRGQWWMLRVWDGGGG